jgi:hypothetical protein
MASHPKIRKIKELDSKANKLFSSRNAQKMAKNGRNSVRALIPALLQMPSPVNTQIKKINRDRDCGREINRCGASHTDSKIQKEHDPRESHNRQQNDRFASDQHGLKIKFGHENLKPRQLRNTEKRRKNELNSNAET